MTGLNDMLGEQVCHDAVAHWGADRQIDVAIEELSELIQALCKVKRYGYHENVAEETADVMIMLNQLRIIFDGTDYDAQVILFMDAKLKRLHDFLSEPPTVDGAKEVCENAVQ